MRIGDYFGSFNMHWKNTSYLYKKKRNRGLEIKIDVCRKQQRLKDEHINLQPIFKVRCFGFQQREVELVMHVEC